MSKINITTTQNIELEYELGSLGDRILGAIIDWLIIGAYMLIISLVVLFSSIRSGGFAPFIYLVFVPVLFYSLVSETLLNGQSVGKRVAGIKVISLDGQQASFSQYLTRWIFGLLDFTITSNLLALIMVAATEKHQRLGDIVAGTVLIKTTARTTLNDTWFQPTDALSFSVTYPEVVHLKDSDIQLVKEILVNASRTGNTVILNEAQLKLEHILNIKSKNGDSSQFLQTVLSDYNYLTSQL